MGGKVWSCAEERTFWTVIIPSSNKGSLYSRPSGDARGWEELRGVMQSQMGGLARRKYTSLMMYEHFFQNAILERFSPHASRYVRAYINSELATTGMTPRQRSRTMIRQHTRNILSRIRNARLSEARTRASAAASTQSAAPATSWAVREVPVMPLPLAFSPMARSEDLLPLYSLTAYQPDTQRPRPMPTLQTIPDEPVDEPPASRSTENDDSLFVEQEVDQSTE